MQLFWAFYTDFKLATKAILKGLKLYTILIPFIYHHLLVNCVAVLDRLHEVAEVRLLLLAVLLGPKIV